jgi:hypothetical protein
MYSRHSRARATPTRACVSSGAERSTLGIDRHAIPAMTLAVRKSGMMRSAGVTPNRQ